MVAICLACVLLPGSVFGQGRPPLRTPVAADTVLERLPRGYAALEPSSTPDSATPSLDQIQALLATAARTGDARLAARADALLQRFPDTHATAQVQLARAFAAQHRHDFDQAVRLLDGVIVSDPRNGNARLARAQVFLVQGRLDRARADCAALSLGIDTNSGILCIVALSLRRGQYDTAASLLDPWLADAPQTSPSLRYALIMRGEIASRAQQPDAQRWYERALALAPDDVRTLAAYARHLRSRDQYRQTMQLLAHAPDTDGLQLLRTLSAHALRSPEAGALAASQARRYALAHQVGSQPEMRDEAEFMLAIQGNASGALALAQRNFQAQRDYEDVSILRRAALAANRPQALRALQAWAASQQLKLSTAADADI